MILLVKEEDKQEDSENLTYCWVNTDDGKKPRHAQD